MQTRAYNFAWIVMGCGLLASSCAGCRSDFPSDSVTVEGAVTTPFVLPLVVGLNPTNVALGASGIVTVGAHAAVVDTIGTTNQSNVVALGSTGTTNIGLGAIVGAVWSKPSLVLGGANLPFYKAAGTAQVQAGNTFADPAENRNQTPIRQDPFWTYSITTPTTGTSQTVSNGQTLMLAPGNYGPVTVLSGGTLKLNSSGSGQYGFVSLDVESGAIAQVVNPSLTTVSVNSTLILKAAFGAAGMTLKYVGTSVTIAAPFTGDLFLAPNASVSINASSNAHFFAKNITVANGVTISATALGGFSSSVQGLLPNATVTPKGVIGNGLASEIASAVMTPALTPSCAEPTAFITYQAPSLVYQKFSAMGSGNPANLVEWSNCQPGTQCFNYPTPPGGCFGDDCAFPASDPNNRPWQWPVKPGGQVEYFDFGANTDNTMTRLDGGRAISVGFSRRYCDDPNPIPLIQQGPNCPASEPAGGAACNSSLVTGKCIYGTTPADWCTCSNNAFSCTRLRRLEEGTLGVRMTSDCGGTWTTGQLDSALLGDGQVGNDRPESYFDPFDKKLYVSEILKGAAHCGTDRNVVYVASTAGVTNASQFTFQKALSRTADAAPEVMTTVLDERAQLTSGTGRWVHFATARCPAGAGKMHILFVPPSGIPQEIALENASDPTTECHNAGLPFGAMAYGPSIVGISSSPPRLYVAYGGTNGVGNATINVWVITLRSAQGYAGPHTIERLALLSDTANHHFFFPQLIRADGQAGSDLTVDTPVILRYTMWDGADTLEERAVPLYSGLFGNSKLLASWSVMAACGPPPDGSAPGCFAGDYRYGSFVDKISGKLTFFTPWTGQWSTGSTPPQGVFASGATIEIAP